MYATGAQVSAASSAPPKTELVLGRKWTVENHKGNRALIIDQTDPKQSVYIFNCHNSTVQVKLCNQHYFCMTTMLHSAHAASVSHPLLHFSQMLHAHCHTSRCESPVCGHHLVNITQLLVYIRAVTCTIMSQFTVNKVTSNVHKHKLSEWVFRQCVMCCHAALIQLLIDS